MIGMINKLRSVLPHIIIIVSGIFLVFMILDYYNPTMNFVNNNINMKLFLAFCVLSIVNSVLTIIANRKKTLESQDKKMNSLQSG